MISSLVSISDCNQLSSNVQPMCDKISFFYFPTVDRRANKIAPKKEKLLIFHLSLIAHRSTFYSLI